jgi:SAM-dependent methyltransferase
MDRNHPAYYDNLNEGLLESIPPEAGLVLEIGCGAGRLGMEYKKRNPAGLYYGVEIDAPAAAVAATRLDMALCGSIETLDFSFLAGKLDCVVYGDVLEHLIDPWSVVKKHAALLAPSGKIVACIPNGQHWTILAGLMAGQWTYQENGLMDRTHLRFFTLQSISSMFEGAGLAIEKVIGRTVESDRAAPFFETLGPALKGLGVDPQTFRQQANVFQYLVTASRAPAAP